MENGNKDPELDKNLEVISADLRKKIVQKFAQFEYENALEISKKLVKISKNLFFHQPRFLFTSYIVDCLLLVKCYFRVNKLKMAEESLDQVWALVDKFYVDNTFKIVKIDKRMLIGNEQEKIEAYFKSLNVGKGFDEDIILGEGKTKHPAFEDNEKLRNSILVVRELKKRTSLLSILASFYHNLGNFRKAEKAYIYYVKLIEANYGLNSMEVANCYYMLALFYLENNYLKKAMSCLNRCLQLRIREFGDSHTAVADCYHNIGLVYIFAGRPETSQNWLKKSLEIRTEKIG